MLRYKSDQLLINHSYYFLFLYFRLYENHNLKWDEASLEQKMAALKLETQKQLLNEFMLRKAQIQNVSLTYPTEIHVSVKYPNNNFKHCKSVN